MKTNHPLPRAEWERIKALGPSFRVLTDGRVTLVSDGTRRRRLKEGRAKLARHEAVYQSRKDLRNYNGGKADRSYSKA